MFWPNRLDTERGCGAISVYHGSGSFQNAQRWLWPSCRGRSAQRFCGRRPQSVGWLKRHPYAQLNFLSHDNRIGCCCCQCRLESSRVMLGEQKYLDATCDRRRIIGVRRHFGPPDYHEQPCISNLFQDWLIDVSILPAGLTLSQKCFCRKHLKLIFNLN